MASFSTRILRWQQRHGRHGLPWQGTRDAYRIWVSEIMLQQTQVATVIPYYGRFMARFPTVAALAEATQDEVLALWSGLGYYARARCLHRAAREVMQRHAGAFPATFEALHGLPGVGRSTAAAIAAFASGERRAILDGNVRRVIARHAGIGGDPGSAATLQRLWAQAEARLPGRGIERYTQGMMDLGAEVCTQRRPACMLCPVSADCVARLEDRVAELPAARRRGPRRRRRIAMYAVLRGAEVLLEKRPASGVWGGLWSLPEGAADEHPGEALGREWGIEALEARPLAAFEHAFTHFTLEVCPWRVVAREPAPLATEPNARWVALDALAEAALPAPVRSLLLRLGG